MIDTREEYDQLVSEGKKPLIDLSFDIEFELRRAIQRELFGRGNSHRTNQRFYHWVWSMSQHECEECYQELLFYRAWFISHILPRSAFPEMAHDPRNVNILCPWHHKLWETEPRGMAIYGKNQDIIAILKKEYRYRDFV